VIPCARSPMCKSPCPCSVSVHDRVEDDFAEWLARFDEAMGRRRFPEGQNSVDENLEDPGSGQLKRALQIFSALRAQSTDDSEALLIEAPHVEGDQPAAMSTDGHEPASRREAFERAWPEGRIADVLEDCVSSVASCDLHDLSLEILSAIVHPEIGAKRHG